MRHFKYLVLIAIVALVTGCASQSGTETEMDAAGATDSGATTRGVGDDDMQGGSAVGDNAERAVLPRNDSSQDSSRCTGYRSCVIPGLATLALFRSATVVGPRPVGGRESRSSPRP